MLTTLDALKAELDIADAASDTALTALIGQWSATVETFCRRSFAVAETTDMIRLDKPCKRLVLERVPVTVVSAVTVAGTALDPSAVEIDHADAGFLLRVNAAGRSLGWPVDRIVVTYIAGYATTPPDVERCVLDLCVRAWTARGRDPALRSEKILDVIDQSYVDPDKVAMRDGLPADVADRLDSYRLMSR